VAVVVVVVAAADAVVVGVADELPCKKLNPFIPAH